MPRFEPAPTLQVGVQIQPQGTSVAAMRGAWKAADERGADSIWVWDHFFPLFGDPDETHFEAWTLLAVMAADTTHAKLGTLVTGNNYRNPELLADMARTIDHVAAGRIYLAVGAGWFERDYSEYGYDFGTAASRLRQLGEDLPRMRDRLDKLNPPALGPMPLMIGGSGPRVTLRLTAQHADSWNTFGPPEHFAEKNQILNAWCEELDRDPAEIERTVAIAPDDVAGIERYVEAGAEHVIVMIGDPFDLAPLESLINQRNAIV